LILGTVGDGLRFIVSVIAAFTVWPLGAAERYFDFSGAKLNEAPPGFRSTVGGDGKPGEWKVIEDATGPRTVAPEAKSSVTTRHQVLAQLSRDTADEHFPMLIFEGEAFDDFTLTTRFKTVDGAVEQMAGIAFHIQDEKNFYVARASSLGNSFRVYKVADGQRSPPVGKELEIPKNVWHELTIECKGNEIRCLLNGQQVVPAIKTDNSFAEGKIGFWTKSDSVSYFGDTKIVYRPKETLATLLVRQTLKKYPRLLGLKVFATTGQRKELHVVASDSAVDLGRAATEVEQGVVGRDVVYCGRGKKETLVTLPLHDRNGDAIAAVRFVLQPYAGQTEQAALARAMPILRELETRVRSARDLTQ